MSSKAFLLLGFLSVVFLLIISSEAAARDSAETSSDNKNEVTKGLDDEKYLGGGFSGYPGGGYGGGYPGGGRDGGGYEGGGRGGYGWGRGYCPYGCCDYGNYNGRDCRRCCPYKAAAENVNAKTEALPHN